jgi:hypothetical protein
MSENTELQSLRDQVAALSRQVQMLEDVNAIRNLQYTYGYFMDKGLYAEVVDLFADDGELSFMGGLYQGKESVRRLYEGRLRKLFTRGRNHPIYGMLVDHMQSQGVIHIAADRLTARARFRGFLQGGVHKTMADPPPHLPRQWWEAGVYENVYCRADEVWKIRFLNYNLQWQATFEDGWANTEVISTNFPVTYPEDPLGPDVLHGTPPKLWPETWCVPFHYPHPVTRQPIKVGQS